MAYSERAISVRKCTGTRKDGQPCRSWAVWGDARQLCAQHAGRGRRGPQPWPPAWMTRGYPRANYEPCTCVAYAWPHKPGGGLCRWPEEPHFRLLTPPSTHFYRGPYSDVIRAMSVRRGQRIR